MSTPLTVGSLLSGVDGLGLGLEFATGGQVLWQVEKESFCREVLAKHWPDAIRYDDVRTVGASIGPRADGGVTAYALAPVDVICGGFPCQDVSVAGKRAGFQGERSSLWREYRRIVAELRPRFVFVENVPGLTTSHGGWDFGEVLGDLASLGFDAQWDRFRASHVGAPHKRERVVILAYRRGELAEWWESERARGSTVSPIARFAGAQGLADAIGLEGGERYDANVFWRWAPDAEQAGVGGSEGLANAPFAGLERSAAREERTELGAAVRRGEDVAHANGERKHEPQGSIGNERGWASDSGGCLGELAHTERGRREEAHRDGGGLGAPGAGVCGAGSEQAVSADGGSQAGVGLADSCFEGLPRNELQTSSGAGSDGRGAASELRSTQDGRDGGITQPRMGGAAHGVSAGLDEHRWPAGPGEAQHPWEAPRVTKESDRRRDRLKALGNAVVPQVAALAWCVLIDRAVQSERVGMEALQ